MQGEIIQQVKMQDRNVSETRAICPELTSRAVSIHNLAKGVNAEAGESQGQHQSYKVESCWKGSNREAGRSSANQESL